MLHNVFETLVRTHVQGGFRPWLASGFEFTQGGRLLRLTMRPNVTFHDGEPLTSLDVKYTLDMILDERWSPDPALRAELHDISLVRTVGSEAVELLLRRPNHLILGILAEVPILPAHLYARRGLRNNRLNETPVGTGPFRVAPRKDITQVVLLRNERYWGQRARSPRLVLRAIPEPQKALTALRNNELDILANLYPGYFPKQVSQPTLKHRYRLLRLHPYRLRVLIFNTRRLPMKDRRVRQAIVHLADRQRFVRAARNDLGQVLSGPFSPLGQWYNATLHPHAFDRMAADRLLEAAGWRLHPERKVRLNRGRPMKLHILQTRESAEMAIVAPILKQELQTAGIEASMEVGDFGFVRARMQRGDFDAAFIGLALRPESDLSPYLESHGAFNLGGYVNANVDSLLTLLRTTVSAEGRLPLARRLHRTLYEDLPLCVLYAPIDIMVMDRRVRGVPNNGRWPKLVSLMIGTSIEGADEVPLPGEGGADEDE